MLPRRRVFAAFGFLLLWFSWKNTIVISLVKQDLLVNLNSQGQQLEADVSKPTTNTFTISTGEEEGKETQDQDDTNREELTNNIPAPPAPLLLDDLLSHSGRTKRLQQAKANLRTRMEKLYGSYYETLFEPNGISIGKHWMHKSPSQYSKKTRGKQVQPNAESKGWNRLVRKIKIKLLQVQLGVLAQRQDGTNTKQLYYAQYLWMTGGDILAAGFGNLVHQTYTWVLQDAVQEVFASVGIEFIARNHGIREKQSAPEIALCASAIYGQDFDSIVGDFRSDGKQAELRSLYAHRVALASTKRPALIHHGYFASSHTGETLQILSKLELHMGMPVLINDPYLEQQQIREMPDSVNLTTTSLHVGSQLPPNLLFFKCGNGLEKNHNKLGGKNTGLGQCTKYQFDTTTCPNRGDKMDWNQGWKLHALKGFSYAMTMVEILTAAVESLGEEDYNFANEDTKKKKFLLQKRLDDLLQEEVDYYQPLVTGNALAAPSNWIKKETTETAMFNFTSFFRSPVLCRTPMMPSDTRLRGILINNRTTYGEGYEPGFSFKRIQNIEYPLRGKAKPKSYDNSTNLHIVSLSSEKGRACPEPGIETTQSKSFRDFFYVSSTQGWRGLTIPNAAEEEQYSDFTQSERKGWIILCFLKCTELSCTETMILSNEPKSPTTNIEMEVNGIPVAGYAKPLHADGKCRALQHEDKYSSKQFIWTPNDNGRYHIRLRITDTETSLYSNLKISSIILM